MAHRFPWRARSRWPRALTCLASTVTLACGGSGASLQRTAGQTSFSSTTPGGRGGPSRGGSLTAGESDNGPAAAVPASGAGSAAAAPRTVEETDLYRLEGDRLYYLNAYRGLMVFDVSNVDAPKLLGRSPIYGSPVEMIVKNGLASVVVADWYGTSDNGEPFYGSIVRGIDATDPANMKLLGDARLGGWVRDTRVVGDVLYAVSEDYGSSFGGYDEGLIGGTATAGSSQAGVSVSSVNIAGGQVAGKGSYRLPGSGGIFNVNARSILLAHSLNDSAGSNQSSTTELVYIDISDPQGAIQAARACELRRLFASLRRR